MPEAPAQTATDTPATTDYILLAIQFEEHDLVGYYGDTYRAYREHTPMLVPFAKGPHNAARVKPAS